MKELNTIELCKRLRVALLDNGQTMQVHSVFGSVINIICEDILFSIFSGTHSLYPMSCRVSTDIPFIELGIREGMEVFATLDKILIPRVDLLINLKDSKERNLSFDQLTGLLVPEDLFMKVEILKELIADKGCEDDLSTLITGKYCNPYADYVIKKLPELNEAIKKSSILAKEKKQEGEGIREDVSKEAREQVGELAGGLAGCGIGLTPSSDDLLVGYISAYLADSKAKGLDCEVIYKVTNTMGYRASKRTNTISGAFLKQCGMGLLSEDMIKLMSALYSNSSKETVRKYAQRIQSFGSTSGTDMLTGAVLAVLNLNIKECP